MKVQTRDYENETAIRVYADTFEERLSLYVANVTGSMVCVGSR